MAYWPQKLLLNGADHIAAISKTSKRFIEEMGLTKNEITVIYNATSSAIEAAQTKDKKTKNIIYMGSFMPYKNAETLIKAMEFLPKGYNSNFLVDYPVRQEELSQLIQKGLKIIFRNGVSEADYATLLQNAHCLATASKEEGFGLPIVEAHTYGTPVVCTDMEIFHEVAGKRVHSSAGRTHRKSLQQLLRV